MDLALTLGCTLAELGERMSIVEFHQWFDAWSRGLWGRHRADLRAATVAATVANYAGRIRPDGQRAASPLDFMPPDPYATPASAPPGPTPAEFAAQFKRRKP